MSSTMIFVESPHFMPTLPQPLHEADRLSRKLHVISKHVIIERLKSNILELL